MDRLRSKRSLLLFKFDADMLGVTVDCPTERMLAGGVLGRTTAAMVELTGETGGKPSIVRLVVGLAGFCTIERGRGEAGGDGWFAREGRPSILVGPSSLLRVIDTMCLEPSSSKRADDLPARTIR